MAKVTSRHYPADHPIFSEGPTTFVPWSPKSTKTSASGTGGEDRHDQQLAVQRKTQSSQLFSSLSELNVNELITQGRQQEIVDQFVDLVNEYGLPGDEFAWADEDTKFPESVRTWLGSESATTFLSQYIEVTGHYIDIAETPFAPELLDHFRDELRNWFGTDRAGELISGGRPHPEEESYLREQWSREAVDLGGGSIQAIGRLKHSNGSSMWFTLDLYEEHLSLVDLYPTFGDALHYLRASGFYAPISAR